MIRLVSPLPIAPLLDMRGVCQKVEIDVILARRRKRDIVGVYENIKL